MLYIIIGVTFLTTILIVVSVSMLFGKKPKHIDKLKFYDENYSPEIAEKKYTKTRATSLKKISELMPKTRVNKAARYKKELALIQGDIAFTLEEILLMKLLTTAVFSFVAYVLSGELLVVLLIGGVTMKIPNMIINKRRKNKLKAFDGQLNDGLILMANSLKAGYSFMQAMAIAAEEMEAPFGTELKVLMKETNLGLSLDEALNNFVDRSNSQDLKLVVNAILIQKDVGGNLSEIIENISETIRERQAIQNELRTLTAQGKLSGSIVMLMPIGLGMVIYLLNKEFMMLLFTTKLGLIMLGMAVVSQFIGWFIIKKIISVDM